MKTQSYLDRWHAKVPVRITLPALLGFLAFAVGIVGFGYWSATAQLSSAAVANGRFVATGKNKIIQHLEGGIVKEIRVKEGDLVEEGATLFVLDGTAANAELRRLVLRRLTLMAITARLDAERKGKDGFSFPAEIVEQAQKDAELAHILDSQQQEFSARKEERDSEIKVMLDRIEAIRQEVRGLEAQKTSVEKQVKLLSQEIQASKSLLDKGLMKLSRYLALQRAQAELEGQIGKHEADIGRAKERITEAESQIVHIKSRHREESTTRYGEMRGSLADVVERIKSARDVIKRLEVRSPVRGVVVKLHHNTLGGVIDAGEDLVELLPSDELLLVEARIALADKDAVNVGLKAQLRLVALNQRTTPTVEGTVIYVSADSIEGRQPGELYYIARIELDEASLVKIQNLEIAPGMPVEVYIQTGERTFVEYILKPIIDSFNRAFKEA